MKCIDLFAGIGGIRKGFEKSFGDEIETVFISEIDKECQKTYKMNFKDSDDVIFVDDIKDIDEKDIPSFDICLAGFPCQAFSVAGKRKGFNDNYKGICRGTLFMEIIRICDYHKPSVIFCENVKGLLHHDKGNTFKVIKNTFEEIGYKVFYKVLNSKDFGVPQNRERIYIVCFREDISPSEFEFPEGNSHCSIKDILMEIHTPKYYISERYLNGLKEHRKRQELRGNKGLGYIIRDINGITGTLVCGGMGHEKNLIVDDRDLSIKDVPYKYKINEEYVRKLTPREWARLQSFDEDFSFPCCDTTTYKQLGNSVTISVIKAIADKIKEKIFSAKSE